MTDTLPLTLGTRHFTLADQLHFAALSGDANPIHVDPGAARRLGAAGTIVHGIHDLLWCLDRLAAVAGPLGAVAALRVNFDSFLAEGAQVEAMLVSRTESRAQIEARSDGQLVLTAVMTLGSARVAVPPTRPARLFAETSALDLSADEMAGLAGRIDFVAAPGAWMTAFPHACAWLGAAQIAALGAASTLVGMVCPGLYSIFNRIALDATANDDAATLGFHTRSVDATLRRVGLAVSGGGWAGNLTAMIRHKPVIQPLLTDLTALVSPDAFAGVTALVVGGSRGLGEVAAKLIAAGGGTPIITYAAGAVEARAVATEIAAWGRGCHVMRLDVERDIAAQLAGLPALPDWLLHFATPAIIPRRGTALDPIRLQRFLQFYAVAFEGISRHLLTAGVRSLAALYPSSVYVQERPSGLAEYAMAKAAGEVLCQDMAARLPGFRATILRLPPLATDQNPQLATTDAAAPHVLAGLLALQRSAIRA